MHDNKCDTNYASNVPYIKKYHIVNTIPNYNMHHTTKTVQKQTKPFNENNQARNWQKDDVVIIYNCFSLYGETSLLRMRNNTK